MAEPDPQPPPLNQSLKWKESKAKEKKQ